MFSFQNYLMTSKAIPELDIYLEKGADQNIS
jgi:hypothetical protein